MSHLLDWVPIRAWLLLIIGLIAITPASYVLRYRRSSAQDVTAPSAKDEPKDRLIFALSMFALILLVALSFFIFTRAAEDFSHSPVIFPLILTVLMTFFFYLVLDGYSSGEVEWTELILSERYNRVNQPKRYWLLMIRNIFFAILMAFLTFKSWEDLWKSVV